MGDSQLSGNTLANILVDNIFIEKDTTAAELMIIGIADTLESRNGLSAIQREYVKRAFKALINDPENPKQAFGIQRKDKRGNFKGMELWEEMRDHLIYLHELKFRHLGYKGDELFKSIKSALNYRFTLTNEAINRAKKRVKHEYAERQLSLESIEDSINGVLESLI
jgi:hypothetical protein